MSTEQSKKTVAVDFDAVIAEYDNWETHGDCPGQPRRDAIDGLKKLKEAGWLIGINSTRNTNTITQWIQQHGLEELFDWINVNPNQPANCAHKPIAHIYIDDRAARYDGSNMDQIVEMILDGRSEPWYKSKKHLNTS